MASYLNDLQDQVAEKRRLKVSVRKRCSRSKQMYAGTGTTQRKAGLVESLSKLQPWWKWRVGSLCGYRLLLHTYDATLILCIRSDAGLANHIQAAQSRLDGEGQRLATHAAATESRAFVADNSDSGPAKGVTLYRSATPCRCFFHFPFRNAYWAGLASPHCRWWRARIGKPSQSRTVARQRIFCTRTRVSASAGTAPSNRLPITML